MAENRLRASAPEFVPQASETSRTSQTSQAPQDGLAQPQPDDTIYPVLNNLYIGSFAASTNLQELERNQIYSVISITSSQDPVLQELVNKECRLEGTACLHYHCYPFEDDNIYANYQDILKFMEWNWKWGKNVLVCSMMGGSRAHAIVLGYLMRQYGMPYQEAFDRLQATYWVPHVPFIRRLAQWACLGFPLDAWRIPHPLCPQQLDHRLRVTRAEESCQNSRLFEVRNLEQALASTEQTEEGDQPEQAAEFRRSTRPGQSRAEPGDEEQWVADTEGGFCQSMETNPDALDLVQEDTTSSSEGPSSDELMATSSLKSTPDTSKESTAEELQNLENCTEVECPIKECPVQ